MPCKVTRGWSGSETEFIDHDVIDTLCKPASFASCRTKRVMDTFLPFIYEVNDLSK